MDTFKTTMSKSIATGAGAALGAAEGLVPLMLCRGAAPFCWPINAYMNKYLPNYLVVIGSADYHGCIRGSAVQDLAPFRMTR